MAGNRKIRRFFSALVGLIGVLLFIGLVYVGAALLHSPDAEEKSPAETREPVTPMQAGSFADAQELAGLFGAKLPVMPGQALRGQAVNLERNGKTVRKVTLVYDGITVTAVRPADAAPLLLREGMSLSAYDDLEALGLPAAAASWDDAFCLYFSDDEAAYSVYFADGETAADAAARLQWTK